MHIFGYEPYMDVPKEQRKNLDDKAEKFILIGYSEELEAFRLLEKSTNEIKIS